MICSGSESVFEGMRIWFGCQNTTRIYNKKTVQEVVDKTACMNFFGFDVIKSDKERLVLKCLKEGCKWDLQASKIGKTEMFLFEGYTKMHT